MNGIKGIRGFQSIPVEIRFWPQVEKTPTCWLWKGNANRQGYGKIFFNKDQRLAHRISWTLAFGPIPEGLCVCHRCDNPPCVNPEHLFLGTVRDNTLDMIAKGRNRPARGERSGARTHPERIRRGERNGMSKLTDEKVRAIRARYAEGISQRTLAREHGVHQGIISKVVRRESWRHVPEATPEAQR